MFGIVNHQTHFFHKDNIREICCYNVVAIAETYTLNNNITSVDQNICDMISIEFDDIKGKFFTLN
jgi:hypothetical protein